MDGPVEKGLSWMMLALFGTGVGLWFLYGLMRMSGPLMAANGLTRSAGAESCSRSRYGTSPLRRA